MCIQNPVLTKPAGAKPGVTQNKSLKFLDIISGKDILSLKENSFLLLLSNDDREISLKGPQSISFDSLIAATLHTGIAPGSGKLFYFLQKYGLQTNTPTYPFNALPEMRCPPDPFHPIFHTLQVYSDTVVYAHKFTSTSTGLSFTSTPKKVTLISFMDEPVGEYVCTNLFGRNELILTDYAVIMKITIGQGDQEKCSESSDLLIKKLSEKERTLLEEDYPSFQSKSEIVKAFYFEMHRLYSDAALAFEKAIKNNSSNQAAFNLFLTRNRLTEQILTYTDLEVAEKNFPSPMR